MVVTVAGVKVMVVALTGVRCGGGGSGRGCVVEVMVAGVS